MVSLDESLIAVVLLTHQLETTVQRIVSRLESKVVRLAVLAWAYLFEQRVGSIWTMKFGASSSGKALQRNLLENAWGVAISASN